MPVSQTAKMLLGAIYDAYEMGYDFLYLTPDFIQHSGHTQREYDKAVQELIEDGSVLEAISEPGQTTVLKIGNPARTATLSPK